MLLNLSQFLSLIRLMILPLVLKVLLHPIRLIKIIKSYVSASNEHQGLSLRFYNGLDISHEIGVLCVLQTHGLESPGPRPLHLEHQPLEHQPQQSPQQLGLMDSVYFIHDDNDNKDNPKNKGEET
jgi:hypothetical protein